MQLVDTHCHIHSADYPLPIDQVEANAKQADVTRLICVGTDADDSRRAVQFVQNRPNHWASIGIHPHEAKEGESALKVLNQLLSAQASTPDSARTSASPEASRSPGDWSLLPLQAEGAEGKQSAKSGPKHSKIIAIGECGLDYYYNHSSKPDQQKTLHNQIQLALKHNLPLIFHVREAYHDFWPIFDQYPGLRGVLHSFTDTPQNLEKALNRNLYIGINGIMTFTKNEWQHELVKNLPLKNILLETDAPFLTPVPYRGKINEPANISAIVNFLSDLQNQSPEDIANATTNNARQLFSI